MLGLKLLTVILLVVFSLGEVSNEEGEPLGSWRNCSEPNCTESSGGVDEQFPVGPDDQSLDVNQELPGNKEDVVTAGLGPGSVDSPSVTTVPVISATTPTAVPTTVPTTIPTIATTAKATTVKETAPPTTPPSTKPPPTTTKPPSTTTPSTMLPSTSAPPTKLVNSSTTTKELPLSPTVPAKELEPAISISIFLIFLLLSICSILVHLMIKYRLKFLPESIAFVLIGFIVGIFYNTILPVITHQDLTFHERFSPQSFFLLLLPPIIFESGYSLHKGNFFQNLGSIIIFAVFGTAISTFLVGGGLGALSKLGVVYELTWVQCFSFGALISAVDPVATLAIFHALDVNPTLNMLVFGESVLNDAVSIVMTKTILQQSESNDTPVNVLLKSLGSFLLMFVGSAVIGIIFALASAVFLKYVNLRRVYSLEFAMWVLFAFGPYFFAEGLHLSGIMAVLFCGIVMSHYTHYNLSPVTQVTVQQTMRTVSFMAETVVFLYIGMQVFAIRTSFRVELIIWSLILILVGRAINIFPLSFLVNRFRSIKINSRMQFIMWFSGLRGAVAYALALNLADQGSKFASKEVIEVLSTTTLIIVLFTILVFGGSTLPILKCLSKGTHGSGLTLSKTEDVGVAPAVSEDREEIFPEPPSRGRHQWFMILDYRFFKPFLIRRFTKQEVHDARIEMQRRTNEWYQGLRAISSDEDDIHPGASKMVGINVMETSLRERRDKGSPSSSHGSMDITVEGKSSPLLVA